MDINPVEAITELLHLPEISKNHNHANREHGPVEAVDSIIQDICNNAEDPLTSALIVYGCVDNMSLPNLDHMSQEFVRREMHAGPCVSFLTCAHYLKAQLPSWDALFSYTSGKLGGGAKEVLKELD